MSANPPSVSLSPKKLLENQDIRFLIEFSPSKPLKRMKFILKNGFCFVPLPGSSAKVSVFAEGSKPLSGSFSVYDSVTDSTIKSETTMFKFTVPESEGLYKIRWSKDGAEKHIFCAVPVRYTSTSSGYLDGKRIGKYSDPKSGPKEVKRHAVFYKAPEYFLKLTEENMDLNLSPNVKISDLVCFTGKNNLTRHINMAPVNYYLLIKVEAAWKIFSRRFPHVKKWRYISWYRTPRHNKGQRGATFSSHIYGDACDIIVDENGDWRMDDINGDGKVDRKDCIELSRVFEELDLTGKFRLGGIGAYEYPHPESTGASIHTDVRGYSDRWGFSWNSGRKRPFIWYKDLDD